MESNKDTQMTFGKHNPFFREHWDMCLEFDISIPGIMQMAAEKSDWMRFERELLNLLK